MNEFEWGSDATSRYLIVNLDTLCMPARPQMLMCTTIQDIGRNC
jgi:hypothetical protein